MMRSCTLTNSAIGVFLEDIINHKLHSAVKRKMFQIEKNPEKTFNISGFQLFQKSMKIRLKY